MPHIDQFNLSQDVLFQSRVRQAMASTAAAVFSEAQVTSGHGKRAALATSVLGNPGTYTLAFAVYVATDSAVATAAGTVTVANADTQEALVSDAQIDNAVSAIWNAMAGV
jgi:hypothetical protein